MPSRSVCIVGAGPGGLTAAMILATRGYQVDVFERAPLVGGRNARLRLGEYQFDTGPTFLMMPWILREVFAEAGADLDAELTLTRLDPLYALQFADGKTFRPRVSQAETVAQITELFPGDELGYLRFLAREGRKMDRLIPALQRSYDKPWHYLRPELLRTLPMLDAHRSVYDVLSSSFQHEDLRIAMSFQAKYLGMSPWECPGTFSFLAALEHLHGVWHVQGGLCAISEAMARVARARGARIHTSTPVERLLVTRGVVQGVRLADGTEVQADATVINADVAHALSTLLRDDERPRGYRDAALAKRRYSCSTFMLYLGLDRRYEHLDHHTIAFSADYRRNVEEIVGARVLSEDPSFYVHNPIVSDPSSAPVGHSTLYVLVPVPNLSADLDWTQAAPRLRRFILEQMQARLGLEDLEQHIQVEKVLTPLDWREQYAVYRGAVFNLSHDFWQMLWLRPRNRFEALGNCYLVGGGTHPGSGLPTIFESGRISADLLGRDFPLTS